MVREEEQKDCYSTPRVRYPNNRAPCAFIKTKGLREQPASEQSQRAEPKILRQLAQIFLAPPKF